MRTPPPPVPPLGWEPDPDRRGVQKEARAADSGSEARVPQPRHLPGAPAPAAPRRLAPVAAPGACPTPPRPSPARLSRVPGPTYSQLLAAAEKTAKTRRRSERRHERGLMVPLRAPGPGQRLRRRGASRRGGRWASHGRAGARRRARAGARAAGLCLRACRQPCPLLRPLPGADQTVSAAPEPGCGGGGGRAGGRPGGRVGGGPRMGLPGRAQRPGTPPGGGPEWRRWRARWPAGLGFSGGLPGRAPGRNWGPSPLHARPAARRLARPGYRRSDPAAGSLPGPWGQAGTAPPARRCGHCTTALAAPPRPPPAPRSSTPAGPWRPDPSSAATRARPAACAPGARGCAPETSGPPGCPPPGPSLPPGQRVLWPSPSLALTSLSLPGAGRGLPSFG